MNSRKLNQCLLCGSAKLVEVIDLGKQPLSSVFPKADENDPELSELTLMRCMDDNIDGKACGGVQLGHVADTSKMYGLSYGYNSSLSPFMVNHLKEIADTATQYTSLQKGDSIFEIGCNDGTFLKFFTGNGYNLYGMDPSSKKFLDRFPSECEIICDFFNLQNSQKLLNGKKCKLVASIAMFYDLEFPQDFVNGISQILDDEGVWVVELSDLELFFKNLTYDQICHEHLLYLGQNQMVRLAKNADLHLVDIKKTTINGGSACYYFKKSSGTSAKEYPEFSDKDFSDFTNRVLNHRDELSEFIKLAKDAGKVVAGYGASTKGNIVLNYCGIESSDLEFISDTNPFKHDRVTPGTRIKIISHDEMRTKKVDYLVTFIWHLRAEVIADEMDFLLGGGKLIFALPRFHIVDKLNYKRFLNDSFDDLSYSLDRY